MAFVNIQQQAIWTFLTTNLSKVTIDFLDSYRKENKFCLIVYLFSCIEYWVYYNNLVITCITGDSRINYWSWQTVKMPTASLLSCPISSLFTDTIFPGQTVFLDYWFLNIYTYIQPNEILVMTWEMVVLLLSGQGVSHSSSSAELFV